MLRLSDILLAGTLDSNGKPLPGKHLEQLQALASDALRYKTGKLPKKLAAGVETVWMDLHEQHQLPSPWRPSREGALAKQ